MVQSVGYILGKVCGNEGEGVNSGNSPRFSVDSVSIPAKKPPKEAASACGNSCETKVRDNARSKTVEKIATIFVIFILCLP